MPESSLMMWFTLSNIMVTPDALCIASMSKLTLTEYRLETRVRASAMVSVFSVRFVSAFSHLVEHHGH